MWRAGAASAALHGLTFVCLAGLAWRGKLVVDLPAPAVVEDDRTYVDLRAVAADPLTPQPVPSRVGDETRLDPAVAAPTAGQTRQQAVPAPDTGRRPGRTTAIAFRRDRSTLRVRVRDGAETYQPSHDLTAGQTSSPQEIRQEPRVGIGDSARTRTPSSADETVPQLPSMRAVADQSHDAPLARDPLRLEQGKDLSRGVGPLDAEQGERRFDVSRRGPARDDQNSRAASNEAHPSLMDLSATGSQDSRAPNPAHGPSETPGAVSRPSTGANPAVAGASGAERGAMFAQAEAERQYARSELNVRERVKRLLRFPRQLALQLEQGESIVRFVVKPDGRLAGAVELLKSAGFEEFDVEAVRAVTRAAPFAAPGRQLTVSLRVPFENPVVR